MLEARHFYDGVGGGCSRPFFEVEMLLCELFSTLKWLRRSHLHTLLGSTALSGQVRFLEWRVEFVSVVFPLKSLFMSYVCNGGLDYCPNLGFVKFILNE